MPFKIIRNDITKVKADAIVNPANPHPTYAAGTDGAIYQAAGADQLLNERKKIGYLKKGEIAVTSGFKLPAKYIIHAVGPTWIDGKHGEFEVLSSCYRKSLEMAVYLGCRSIAFPLLATGVYGFPKDKALDTARTIINSFLKKNEMNVILVVFDRRTFELSGDLFKNIDSYIDQNYVSKKQVKEYEGFTDAILGNDDKSLLSRISDDDKQHTRRPASDSIWSQKPKESNVDDIIDQVGESFHDCLFKFIDESGMTDAEVYNHANIDRRHFSKIRNKEDYQPTKGTALALSIGLKLDLEDTNELLKSAGFALSSGSKTDLIVKYFIENKNYNINDLNIALFDHGQPMVG